MKVNFIPKSMYIILSLVFCTYTYAAEVDYIQKKDEQQSQSQSKKSSSSTPPPTPTTKPTTSLRASPISRTKVREMSKSTATQSTPTLIATAESIPTAIHTTSIETTTEAAKKVEKRKIPTENLTLKKDTISVINMYRNNIKNLQNGCFAENNQEFCYKVSSNINATTKQVENITTNINLGYGLDDHLSLGATFSYEPLQFFPQTYVVKKNNYLNNGFYAYLHTLANGDKNYYWYLKPSIAFSSGHDVDAFINNDKAHQDIDKISQNKLSSFGLSLKGGQSIILNEIFNLNWYIGLGQINFSNRIEPILKTEKSKSDDAKEVSAKAEKYVDESKLAYVGAKLDIPLINNIKLTSGIEIEREFDRQETQELSNANLNELKLNNEYSKTTGKLYGGLTYNIDKNIEISFTAGVNRSMSKDISWDSLLSVSGKF